MKNFIFGVSKTLVMTYIVVLAGCGSDINGGKKSKNEQKVADEPVISGDKTQSVETKKPEKNLGSNSGAEAVNEAPADIISYAALEKLYHYKAKDDLIFTEKDTLEFYFNESPDELLIYNTLKDYIPTPNHEDSSLLCIENLSKFLADNQRLTFNENGFALTVSMAINCYWVEGAEGEEIADEYISENEYKNCFQRRDVSSCHSASFNIERSIVGTCNGGEVNTAIDQAKPISEFDLLFNICLGTQEMALNLQGKTYAQRNMKQCRAYNMGEQCTEDEETELYQSTEYLYQGSRSGSGYCDLTVGSDQIKYDSECVKWILEENHEWIENQITGSEDFGKLSYKPYWESEYLELTGLKQTKDSPWYTSDEDSKEVDYKLNNWSGYVAFPRMENSGGPSLFLTDDVSMEGDFFLTL